MNVIHTSKAPAAIGPYEQAYRHGEFIFTSGQIGADPAAVFQLSGWMLCFVLNWQSLPSMVMRAIIISSPFFFSEPFFK